MNPSVITYVGLIIAVFILVWGSATIYQRYAERSKRRKVDVRAMHTWVPLKPAPIEPGDDQDVDDDQEQPANDVHPKAQQNGHYSESKRLL